MQQVRRDYKLTRLLSILPTGIDDVVKLIISKMIGKYGNDVKFNEIMYF